MRHSSLTEKQFEKNYKEVCDAAVKLAFGGGGNFNGDFICVENATETEIRDQIASLVGMNSNDVERYIYVTTLNNMTLIKK